MKVCTKFEVRNFTQSSDNSGYSKNWAGPGYAHAPFSQKFLMGFCSDGPCEWTSQSPYSFLPVSEIIAIEVLGVANPQSWGTGGRRGSALVLFERVLVNCYKPSIVSFPLSLRVEFRDIAPFVLQPPARHFSHPTSIATHSEEQ